MPCLTTKRFSKTVFYTNIKFVLPNETPDLIFYDHLDFIKDTQTILNSRDHLKLRNIQIDFA